jgi:diguanylate cyclase (GGDEF)-like protein
VAVIAGLAFALQIRRRLSQLTQTAEALAGGDLDRRLTVLASDEIGRLGKSFNAMADRLKERTRDAAGLRKLSDLVQACGSVEEAFEVTEQVVPSFFPGSRGIIHILNSSRTLLEVYGLFGEGAKELIKPDPASPDDCWAFRRGAPYRVEKGGHTPACRHMAANGQSYACFPLTAHGENLGVLTLSPMPEGERIAVAELLAEQIGMAVGNLRLRDSLRNQAVRDALTGLFNRRYFEEVAEREIARAKRHQRSVAFFMVDVDHFKRFNDNFGHDAGDFLLREVGQLLKTSIRQSDVACRYGGEEFVLILPESTAEDSRGRAEQLRQAFHRLQLTHQGRALAGVTVSIGVAAFPSHGEDRHTVLRAADAGLYRAKEEGRDRVVVAPESAGAPGATDNGREHADA